MEKIIESMHLWEKLADIKPSYLREKLESLSGLKSESVTRIMEYADKCCGKVYPFLPVTLYKRFADDGNRSAYESLYFERRDDLFYLATAEYFERKGKYINKIFDLLWAVCEETSWILPAHYCQYKKNTNIPDNYDCQDEHYIDLFSATTGADLAVIYSLLRDSLDANGGGVITARIQYELKHRIIKPFLVLDDMFWMGLQEQSVNNWNPWIISNVLTIAYVEEDIEIRKKVVEKASKCLDRFIALYGDDGGCNEGPGYWTAAGGALFDSLEVLCDLTCCDKSVFSPQLKPIMEYICKVHISGPYFVNYGDNGPRWEFNGNYLKRMGTMFHSASLIHLGKEGELAGYSERLSGFHPLRVLENLYDISEGATENTPCKVSVLQDMQLCVMHENNQKDNGFCVWLKGGHNAESHNHNDVGNAGIYLDGIPLLVDMGVGEYTKYTFNEMRYTLFPIRSCDHNLPLIDSIGEKEGKIYKADLFKVSADNLSACIEYKSAYENRDLINKLARNIKIQDHKVILEDCIDLKSEHDIQLHLYFCEKADKIDNGILIGNRVKMTAGDAVSVNIEKIELTDRKLCRFWENGIYKVTLHAGKTKMLNCQCIFEKLPIPDCI